MKRLLAILFVLLTSSAALAVWPLDGSTQYIESADAAVFDLPDGNWSIMWWFKPDTNAGSGDHYLITGGGWTGGSDPGIHIKLVGGSAGSNPNKLHVSIIGNTGAQYPISSTTPGTSTDWMWAAVYRTGEVYKLVIDGTEVYSGTNSAVNGVATAGIWSFGAYTDGTLFFDGSLAEIAKCDSALTADQIARLSGTGAYAGSPEAPNSAGVGLTLQWYMDCYDAVDCQVGSLSLTNHGSVTATTTGHPITYAEDNPVLILVQ